MTRRYVDSQFASQTTKVWAAGTPSAEAVSASVAYTTLSAAMGAASSDDLIFVAAGTYTPPETWTASVLSIQGIGDTTIINGPVLIDIDRTLRLNRLTIGNAWTVLGKLGGVSLHVTGRVVSTGTYSAVVFADFDGEKPVLGSDGAIAFYRPPRFPFGGPSTRRPSEYRLTGRIECPARGKKTSGAEDLRHVWLGDRKFRREEQTAREGQQVAVQYADSTGVLYCRGGFPFHADMNVTIGQQTYEIRGVVQSPTPENETKLYVNERKRGV